MREISYQEVLNSIVSTGIETTPIRLEAAAHAVHIIVNDEKKMNGYVILTELYDTLSTMFGISFKAAEGRIKKFYGDVISQLDIVELIISNTHTDYIKAIRFPTEFLLRDLAEHVINPV